MKSRKEALRFLIRKVEVDKPALNFTALVMEQVAPQNEAVMTPALKALLKGAEMEKPSPDFTQRIMSRLEKGENTRAYQPIISKNVWRIVLVLAGFFAVSVGFSGQGVSSPGGLTRYLIQIGNALVAIFANINSASPLYLMTVLAMSALLGLDYLIRVHLAGTAKK